MTLRFEDIRWDGLFPHQPRGCDLSEFGELHRDRCILITGAGGSIGAELSRAILRLKPRTLVLLDSSEQNLYYIDRELSACAGETTIAPVLGSVADPSCIADVFARHRPRIIYHSAALKHVPLGEKNPFAVVQNNVFGTSVIARFARDLGAERLLMVSTDKSVNPESIMGASKKLAEMLLYAGSGERTRMTSIRLGNVLGSEGSVVPLFLKQIADGGPVTVTDPAVERFFLTVEVTVHHVLAAMAECPPDAAIAVPVLSAPVKIADLARYLIAQTTDGGIEIKFTGLRPGDKLHEQFVGLNETLLPNTSDTLKWLTPTRTSPAQLDSGLAQLESAVHRRDLIKLLEAMTRLVPEYQPSEYLREQVVAAERR